MPYFGVIHRIVPAGGSLSAFGLQLAMGGCIGPGGSVPCFMNDDVPDLSLGSRPVLRPFRGQLGVHRHPQHILRIQSFRGCFQQSPCPKGHSGHHHQPQQQAAASSFSSFPPSFLSHLHPSFSPDNAKAACPAASIIQWARPPNLKFSLNLSSGFSYFVRKASTARKSASASWCSFAVLLIFSTSSGLSIKANSEMTAVTSTPAAARSRP